MKTNSFAFTLIEVVIALSLSCVVVFGMMQAYRNLNTYLERAREILSANRKVCLLFNQMEHDITTAFIPPVYKEEIPEAPQKPLSKEDQEKEKQQKLEKLKTYFVANVNDQEAKRFGTRRVHLFKNMAMINTNPLQVFGQRRERLVRVQYELVLDKKKSKGDVQCYNLQRKETTDIDNIKMKISEFSGPSEKEKANPVITNLVADNIKALYIEYVLKKIKEDTVSDKKKEEEEQLFDTWGQSKETQGVVPARAQIFIEFWDSELRKSYPYSTSFAVFSYPTITDTQLTDTQAGAQPTGAPQTPIQPGSTTPVSTVALQKPGANP